MGPESHFPHGDEKIHRELSGREWVSQGPGGGVTEVVPLDTGRREVVGGMTDVKVDDEAKGGVAADAEAANPSDAEKITRELAEGRMDREALQMIEYVTKILPPNSVALIEKKRDRSGNVESVGLDPRRIGGALDFNNLTTIDFLILDGNPKELEEKLLSSKPEDAVGSAVQFSKERWFDIPDLLGKGFTLNHKVQGPDGEHRIHLRFLSPPEGKPN